MYKLHLSPLDFDQMEFYRLEYLLKNFEESLDEEDKAYKKQEQDYQKQYSMMGNQYKIPTQPNLSNYGGFNFPKINLPTNLKW